MSDTAPRVVLVHGAVERKSGFDRVLPLLEDLDVTTYDRRGHGDRWEEGPASLGADIDELLAVVGRRRATVVGHSLGGLVVLGASLQRPEQFAAIGLFETAIPWGDWWTARDRASMMNEIDHNAAAAHEGPAAQRLRLEVAWASCRNEVLDAFSATFRWQDATVPVVTGFGASSRGNSARDASIVADAYGIAAVVLDDAGHRAHWSAPGAFADFVRRCVRYGGAPA